MDCGGLSVAQGLIQEMVKWCADNLDTRILVSCLKLSVSSYKQFCREDRVFFFHNGGIQ